MNGIMNGMLITLLLLLSVAFAILITSPISHWIVAQIQNATLPENTNNTRMVLNLKDKTVTLINATTNETISVRSVAGPAPNMTANETLSVPAPNMTANETLSVPAPNMTANETLRGSVGNMTEKINLTDKFRDLAKGSQP